MALNSDQHRRMSLGGTQALPAPGPELGKIKWASSEGHRKMDRLVEITQEKNEKHANIWFVRVRDLMAIEQKKKLDAKPKKIKWLVGTEIVDALNKASKSIQGIAYVREEAQTLLRMEHGVSAVNSPGIVVSGNPLPTRETDEEFRVKCVSC